MLVGMLWEALDDLVWPDHQMGLALFQILNEPVGMDVQGAVTIGVLNIWSCSE